MQNNTKMKLIHKVAALTAAKDSYEIEHRTKIEYNEMLNKFVQNRKKKNKKEKKWSNENPNDID